MNYIKVTSIEHLDELLEKHVSSEFVIRSGVLRSSKNIQKQCDKYIVYHYIDDTEEVVTAEELMADNIGAAIRNGNFYCETTKDI